MSSPRPKACQLLLKLNYNVYIPISGDEILVIELKNTSFGNNGELIKCIPRKAFVQDGRNPLLHIATRCGKIKYPINDKVASHIVAIADSTLWLISIQDVMEFDSIRLGNKWNHCILGFNKIEDDSRKKRITTAAKRAMKKIETDVEAVVKEEQDAKDERDKLKSVFDG